jgi:hypothetical protein
LPFATITSLFFVPLMIFELLTIVAVLPKHFGADAWATGAHENAATIENAQPSTMTRASLLRIEVPPS